MTKDKPYCVYMHINKKNNKKYVGITSRGNPNLRWQNGNGYKKNRYFYRAILKYGWNNFEHKILYENLSLEDACEIEKKLISKYNTQDENYGYNIFEGGQFSHQTEESKHKISEKRKGKKLSQETKEKIRKNLLGKPSKLKGVNLSEEHKKHISEGLKGHKHSKESKQKMSENSSSGKKIICDNILFKSIRECANYYNLNERTLQGWLSGRVLVPKEFVDKGLNVYGEKFNYVQEPCEGKSIKKPIYYDGRIYESLNHFSKEFNINRSTASKWLSGKNNMPEEFKEKQLSYFSPILYRRKKIKK